MKINAISFLGEYKTVRAQTPSQKSKMPETKIAMYDEDVFVSEQMFKKELMKNAPKHSREAIYRTMNDCYYLSKEQFPNSKITIFFNFKQRYKNKDGVDYAIAIASNANAREGIVQDYEELPGFSKTRDADFYYTKTIHSHTWNKLDYKEVRDEILPDLAKAIEDNKNKPVKEEEETEQKENSFKKIFGKIFNK